MEKMNTKNYVSQKSDSISIADEIRNDYEILGKLESLGVSKNEIDRYATIIYRYKLSKDACAICKGLDKCCSDTFQSKVDLAIGDAGELYCSFGPCDKKLKKDSMIGNYIERDFPEAWLGRKALYSKNDINMPVFEGLKNTRKAGNKRWAYVIGKTGYGKSYILAMFCNELAAKGHSVCFVDTNKKFSELRALSLDKNMRSRFEEEMSKIANAKILVLDNFGTEFKSDYMVNTILRPIISARSNSNYRTYFTSSYTLDEIAILYGTTPQSQLEISTIISVIEKNIEKQLTIKKSFKSEQ